MAATPALWTQRCRTPERHDGRPPEPVGEQPILRSRKRHLGQIIVQPFSAPNPEITTSAAIT